MNEDMLSISFIITGAWDILCVIAHGTHTHILHKLPKDLLHGVFEL